MSAHRIQKTVLAGTSLLAAGIMLTACGPENGSDASGSDKGADKGASSESTAKTGSDSGSDSGSGSDSSTPAAGEGAAKKTSGTLSGRITYMAPGKFMVAPREGGMKHAFYIAKGAKITGWGTICGEPNQKTDCTEAQLESSTKNKKVGGSVTLKNGTATAVTENKPGTAGGDTGSGDTGGGNGTLKGTIKYMAPSKYTVAPASGGREHAFFVSKNTKITGWGTICGEPNEKTDCTEAQLESSSKSKKIMGQVAITNGNATTVTENKPGTAGGDA